MIRVLQVVTILNRGGLETMLMNYYRNIDREKVQFDFLVHREQRGAYEEEIESMGGKIYRMPPISPLNVINYSRQLDFFFHKHPEYKIVHSHLDTLSTIVLRKAKKLGIPVKIAHCHAQGAPSDWKTGLRTISKKLLVRYPDYFFACSKEAGQWAFGNRDVQIIKNAIDAKRYTYDEQKANLLKKSYHLENKFVIGHIGNDTESKNHEFLIDIFSELFRKCPDSHLILVGIGNDNEKMKAKIESLQLQNHVTLLGVRNDVADLLQIMDLFVFPSLYEGLGIVAIEAQAAGMRVFASDKVPHEVDITDLITHLSLNESAEAWAQKILESRGHLKRNTFQEIVNAGYDIESNAMKLQSFYLDLADRIQ